MLDEVSDEGAVMSGARGENQNREVVVSRRVYHVCMGVLEASLYAVPVSFLAPLLLPGAILPVISSVVLWGAIWIWVMQRSIARFEDTKDAPATGKESTLQVTVLRYTALASVILLVFIALPPLLPEGLAGALISPTGVLFFCCAILLVICGGFSLLGLVSRVRRAVYPDYPGFSATFVFALAMASLFFSALTGF